MTTPAPSALPARIRVVLPTHLRVLANVDREVQLDIPAPCGGPPAPITQRTVLDALEARYPALCGTIRGDGRLVMVEILHPTSQDPRVPVAVRDAFERLHVLETEERLALVSALATRPDTQSFVGREEFVRKGVYTSYAHRIVWRKPSPLWTFIPHEMMSDPQHSLAVLQDEEHGTNARLMFFEPDNADTKWTLHQRVVDNVSASAEASSIYFSTQATSVTCPGTGVGSSGFCAVKLTQSALQ